MPLQGGFPGGLPDPAGSLPGLPPVSLMGSLLRGTVGFATSAAPGTGLVGASGLGALGNAWPLGTPQTPFNHSVVRSCSFAVKMPASAELHAALLCWKCARR